MKRYLDRPHMCPVVELDLDDSNLESILSLQYGRYLRREPGDIPAGLHIIEERIGDSQYAIMACGETKITEHPLSEIDDILYDHTQVEDQFFGLHAGAVARGEKGYIFAAPTTAGKTTLTTYLVQQGFSYVTDDCVLINMDTYQITPYPKPVHLRDGGFAVLAQMGLVPPKIEHCCHEEVEQYIYTPEDQAAGQLEIGALFFIERTEKINQVMPLSPLDAMQMLMKGPIAHRKVDSRYLRFLAELSKRRCKRLQYSSLEYVKAWIEEDMAHG